MERRATIKDGIAYVPLKSKHPDRQEAKVLEADYDLLLSLGLSPNWRYDNGGVFSSGASILGSTEARQLAVGRLVTDARPGWSVGYMDRDPCNLLRDNVYTRYTGKPKTWTLMVLKEASKKLQLLIKREPEAIKYGTNFEELFND